MKVKDVMVKKVISINSSDSFISIIKILVKYKISGLPVVNKKGKVIGIISEKDLLSHLFPSEKEFYSNMQYWIQPGRLEEEAKSIKKLKARDLMTKQVISVDPDDSIMHACALVLINNIRRLPVIKNGKIEGIVTTRNLYSNFLKELVQ